ncbi:MAG: PhnD/SsuA/transferrin family substrate-binding protein [Burkholderiales bacterium]|nr:PhnD/SsuA/transferrin family substrate-binding protein [Burkholderiales bacterium]MDE1928921.1 PhnD/SsuA/transferrin family substrate-binding protein [Burkholderiales bacterium]MDE2505255.1 PhnD/SsuA/transferrin family substrate-binding protein [Burkholderiales bacterium]
MQKPLVLGAVAYAPKVVTIWEGFKQHFIAHGLPFDFVLYSNYERQVEDQFDGRIDVAWNSPLAWLRAERIARARGVADQVRAITMRDTDCDLTSVLVVRADSDIRSVADLRGRRIGVGAVDSPQATLIPLQWLREQGLAVDTEVTVVRHDVLGGKHGDHVGGERDAARALVAGGVDAAWMIDGNHLAFTQEGTLPPGRCRVLARTPAFDHCNFTTSPGAPAAALARFEALLMAMSFDDAALRPLLELEGLRAWRGGRTEGYALLERAVTATGFYDARGAIGVDDYVY